MRSAPVSAVGRLPRRSALLLLQAVLSAWRWMVLSRRTSGRSALSGRRCGYFMISQFYNQALPSTVPGDAARMWGAARFGRLRRRPSGCFWIGL